MFTMILTFCAFYDGRCVDIPLHGAYPTRATCEGKAESYRQNPTQMIDDNVFLRGVRGAFETRCYSPNDGGFKPG